MDKRCIAYEASILSATSFFASEGQGGVTPIEQSHEPDVFFFLAAGHAQIAQPAGSKIT